MWTFMESQRPTVFCKNNQEGVDRVLKDSPYTSSISSAILQLGEDGRFIVLKNRWWKLRRGGGKCKDEAAKSGGSANELGLANVGGVFVVLLGGIGIACLIAVCEFIWKSRKLAIDEKVGITSREGLQKTKKKKTFVMFPEKRVGIKTWQGMIGVT
ncbi:unnamed protein product [Cyprideis torosa]|uniref:Uncharacterized protein n=1 Tax=Cyprideis torosa TaxID=163714 RepID=A0A7R8ZYS0_9CRUS|nr:unnamed protein product [Cyprideis torosa]CAG0908917.1 unnamed protein product [Cyprideis torosa]